MAYRITYLELESMLDGSWYVFEVDERGARECVYQGTETEARAYSNSRPSAAVRKTDACH